MNTFKSDLLGSFSGYGYGYDDHYDYYPSYHKCCPLTVDWKTFAALSGFIGLATYLLLTVVEMSMLGRRKKRSLVQDFRNIYQKGE